MFAVISFKGKQYKVSEGQEHRVDLIGSDDTKIVFYKVLLLSDDKDIQVGSPAIEGASVEADVLGEIKDKKVSILKFHAKKRYKRNLGHRERYTVVKITKINKNEK